MKGIFPLLKSYESYLGACKSSSTGRASRVCVSSRRRIWMYWMELVQRILQMNAYCVLEGDTDILFFADGEYLDIGDILQLSCPKVVET